jgi:hypothetical protein
MVVRPVDVVNVVGFKTEGESGPQALRDCTARVKTDDSSLLVGRASEIFRRVT